MASARLSRTVGPQLVRASACSLRRALPAVSVLPAAWMTPSHPSASRRAFTSSTRACLSAEGDDGKPKKLMWWQEKNPFRKPNEEEKRIKEEKHEIIMERLRRSTFYDAKQAPEEKVCSEMLAQPPRRTHGTPLLPSRPRCWLETVIWPLSSICDAVPSRRIVSCRVVPCPCGPMSCACVRVGRHHSPAPCPISTAVRR
jgi:hypothetical protein